MIESVTLVRSIGEIYVHHTNLHRTDYSKMYNSANMLIRIRIPRLSIEWTSPEDRANNSVQPDLSLFLWQYPAEQEQWIARYAPLLPDMCHEEAKEGLSYAQSVLTDPFVT